MPSFDEIKEMTEKVHIETNAPKRERTESQKKATENMLMKLREKREMAEKALSEIKEKKAAGRPAGSTVASGAKRASHQPEKLSPTTETVAAASPAAFDYDELARRVAALTTKPKKPSKKKVQYDYESSSSESDSSSDEDIEVIRKRHKTVKKMARSEPMAPALAEPIQHSTGSRVLDALYYGRR